MVRSHKRQPQDVFQNICGFLLFQPDQALTHLARIKFRGYSLCRHPAFRACGLTDPFTGTIYKNAVHLHKERVRALREAVRRVVQLSLRLQLDCDYTSSCLRVIDLANSIDQAPTLKHGSVITHDNFWPKQEL